ncbi:MAG: archease [Acidimicrobiia bacterium]|nr:archease [Acidimicrobiia bacterium]
MTGRHAERSHRLRPHTADAIVEARGSTQADCLAEAVTALAEVYVADAASLTPTHRIPVDVDPHDPAGSLLEEALFVLDARGLVCVGADLARSHAGVSGHLLAVPAGDVDVTGSIPKGIAGAVLRPHDGTWEIEAIVDV